MISLKPFLSTACNFPCITTSTPIMASSTDRGTDSSAADTENSFDPRTESGVLGAAASPVRSIESRALVAVTTPVRGTEPGAIVTANQKPRKAPKQPKGTRPSIDEMSVTVITHLKSMSGCLFDVMQRGRIFTDTEADEVLLKKIKAACGVHPWIPTVVMCQKSFSFVDRYFGNRVTGNTAKNRIWSCTGQTHIV